MACGCNKGGLGGPTPFVARAKTTPQAPEKTPPTYEQVGDAYFSMRQCFLCAKKHLSRAMILHEEIHTGYAEYLPMLTGAMNGASVEVRRAFKLYMTILAHIDMCTSELVGLDGIRGYSTSYIPAQILMLANEIRNERKKLEDDPTFSFDAMPLLERIQNLQAIFGTNHRKVDPYVHPRTDL